MQQKIALKDPLWGSAQYVKGVGPQRYELLNKLGVFSVWDLLNYFPRRYEDRSNFISISKVTIGNFHTIKGQVVKFGLWRARRGFSVYELAVTDKTGVIYGIWFNQPYMRNVFKAGDEVILYGKVERYKKLQISNPEYEIISEEKGDPVHTGRIVPIYSLTEKISQKWLRSTINKTTHLFSRNVPETLPVSLRAKYKLLSMQHAVKNIHFPASFDLLQRAKKRLVFEELLIMQLAIAIRRLQHLSGASGIAHELSGNLIEEFKKSIPFELTKGQLGAISDIEKDMASDKTMNRLLQGDVGSGKTIVASYGLVLTIQNRYQGAFMAPTEILAEQHYLTLNKLLGPLGMNVVLLISGLSPQEKEQALIEVENGNADVVVGTHALIQEGVKFKKLGLVIIDEQHKFGVTQRAVLKDKGLNPDVLVMTATPIPRTLALTIYGDLDISTINELPPGRKPIRTYWVGEEKREGIYKFIEQQIKEGRQAYVVCPLIEESDKMELKAAAAMYEELAGGPFKGFKVGLLHGRMESQEKQKLMKNFKDKELDILVSTVVIEVGIDVANATVMLIEDADRFGLSQLHQLRGRIGRGQHDSCCILVSNPRTEEGKKRLLAMVQSQDGFQIAQEDLELRGPGEFFGTRQSGLPELKLADLISDVKVLEEAKKEAEEIVKNDPQLNSPANKALKEAVKRKFEDKLEFAGVA